MKPHIIILVFLYCFTHSYAKYSLPELTIEALKPRGVRISMPVTENEDVQLFGFHANINKPIRGKEQGDISRSATRAYNGRWTLEDSKVQLNIGDKLHYWVFAQNNRLGFDKEDQVYEINELVDANAGPICPKSVTSIFNNFDDICANKVLFEDDFKGSKLDETIWDVLQFTPQYALPGREFVSYEKNRENLYLKNESLIIKPTLRDDIEAIPFDLRQGCSLPENPGACFIEGLNAYEVAPPVISARIRSKMAFRYARVEVRARVPRGDWIVPHILLEPKEHKYGDGLESGELYIAYVRGNADLKKGATDIGQSSIYSGPAISTDKTKLMVRTPGDAWGVNYNTYMIEWSPNGIIHSINGRKVATSETPDQGFASVAGSLPYSYKWKTKNAPFDQFFHLTIGVSVGGIIDFPEGIQNDGRKKPWSNTAPKAPIDFNKKRKEWYSTWENDKSELKIDYVKVYAI